MILFKIRYESYAFLRTNCSSFHTQSKLNFINVPIKELVQTSNFNQAVEHYAKLWNNGFKPDNFIFPYVLKASAHLKDPSTGLLIHNHAIKTGFDSNVYVINSLILFYGRFGQLNSTHYLFDNMPQRNVVTWTAVISMCAQNNEYQRAIDLFRDMLIAGVNPNSYTMATLLPAFCYGNGVFQIHGFLIKHGFETDVYVSTALVDVYAKCGYVLSAHRVFEELPEKSLVSWNAMMSGCNQNGFERETLELFSEMCSCRDIAPDSYSIVTLLSSCSSLTMLRSGKEIHCYVYKAGLEGTVFVGNGLVDMYGKCGALEVAERVFHKMTNKDISSWTALINCYGLHGQGSKAISIFDDMRQITTINPNSVTMTAVLTACARSGLVEDGLRCFKAMRGEFHIEPTMKHYACMVDLLGRAGLLEGALEFINKMPVQADVLVWEAMLGAATIQENDEVVETAKRHLIELKSLLNSEVHVQLANAYAKSGRWEDVAKIRKMVQQKKLRKLPGESWIRR